MKTSSAFLQGTDIFFSFFENHLMAFLPQSHYSYLEFHTQLTFLELLLLFQRRNKGIIGCLAIRTGNQLLIRRQSRVSEGGVK